MTRQITIDGYRLTIPEPYCKGHVLTFNEAAALNNHYAVCVRNGFRLQLRALPPHQRHLAQEHITSYTKNYKFQPIRSRDYGDPVEEEARRIARDQIIQNARKRGLEPEVTEDKITTTIDDHPVILEEARRRIESIHKAADSILKI